MSREYIYCHQTYLHRALSEGAEELRGDANGDAHYLLLAELFEIAQPLMSAIAGEQCCDNNRAQATGETTNGTETAITSQTV